MDNCSRKTKPGRKAKIKQLKASEREDVVSHSKRKFANELETLNEFNSKILPQKSPKIDAEKEASVKVELIRQRALLKTQLIKQRKHTMIVMNDVKEEFIKLAKTISKENCSSLYYFDKLVLQNNMEDMFNYEILFETDLVGNNLRYYTFDHTIILSKMPKLSYVTFMFAQKLDFLYKIYQNSDTIDKMEIYLEAFRRIKYFMYYIMVHEQSILGMIPPDPIKKIFMSSVHNSKDLLNVALVCKTSYEAVKQIRMLGFGRCYYCLLITKRSLEHNMCIHGCCENNRPIIPLKQGEYCSNCNIAIFHKLRTSNECPSCIKKKEIAAIIFANTLIVDIFGHVQQHVKQLKFNYRDIMNLCLINKQIYDIAKTLMFQVYNGKKVKCSKCPSSNMMYVSEASLDMHLGVCGQCQGSNFEFKTGDSLCWYKCSGRPPYTICEKLFFIKRPYHGMIPRCMRCR